MHFSGEKVVCLRAETRQGSAQWFSLVNIRYPR